MGRADEARIKRQIAAAVAAYVGPVTKCPPGMARAEEPVKLILRPRYRFGRGDSSVKVKNPAAPAVKREAEEDWN
jgi:hypothetical protein